MAIQVRVDPSLAKQLSLGMPELTIDSALRAKRRVGKVLKVLGPFDAQGQLVVDGLVRLVDKSVLEYQATRNELFAFFPDGYIDRYHRAQDHFESFIQCLHRAITYTDRLRSLGYKHADGTPAVPRPRDFEVLRDANKSVVRRFRETLEHLDEDILGNKIDATDDVGPRLGTHEASIGGISINYADAATWCIQLHELAKPMSEIVLRTGPVAQ